MKPRKKLKALNLHYHNTYGHQTFQGGDMLSGVSLIKSHGPLITWSREILSTST